MSAGRRDLFAVLHWTEPQLRSAPQWYIFAMLHLRSGTSSQCSSGQSHIPVVHLRSAPQWCIFAVVHLRSAPVDRATFQWYIFAVLRQSHIPVVHLHSAPFRLLFFFFSDFCSFSFFFVRLLFFFFLFFLGIVILGIVILGIVIYGSSVATLFSSVLGSLFSSFSSVLQQVAALPSTRTNQMLLSGSPVSASPLASDIASWLSNESMSFLSFL